MYSTVQNMIDRYGEDCLTGLTDSDPPSDEVSSHKVEKALAHATALIDGYLSARYLLPLASVPALITSLAESIAIYYLYVNRPKDIEDDFKHTIETLKQIAKGLVQLPIAQGSTDPVQQGGVEFEGETPLLNHTSLGGFI